LSHFKTSIISIRRTSKDTKVKYRICKDSYKN